MTSTEERIKTLAERNGNTPEALARAERAVTFINKTVLAAAAVLGTEEIPIRPNSGLDISKSGNPEND